PMKALPTHACHHCITRIVMRPSQNRSVVVIVGPTGSGKSHLALRAAERWDGEILNCDSVQIYRHFNIGTAKIPEKERRGIPHHLIDALEPDQVFTAGDFSRAGRRTLGEIAADLDRVAVENLPVPPFGSPQGKMA